MLSRAAQTRGLATDGIERVAPNGGEAKGFRIQYLSNGRLRCLDVPNITLVLCGDNSEYCE